MKAIPEVRSVRFAHSITAAVNTAALRIKYLTSLGPWFRIRNQVYRGAPNDSRYQRITRKPASDLGVMYDQGQGVPQDHAEAVRWYREGADRGHADAQHKLGFIFFAGQGVPQDYAEAASWYRRAADQGHADAQFLLGRMYDQGQGVPQDYMEAHMWINLAASRASGDVYKEYAYARDLVAERITSQQIAEAQRRAREWKPKGAENQSRKPMK